MGRKPKPKLAVELALENPEAARAALVRLVLDDGLRQMLEGCVAVASELGEVFEDHWAKIEPLWRVVRDTPQEDPRWAKWNAAHNRLQVVDIAWDVRLEWARRVLGGDASAPMLRWLAGQFCDRFAALYIWPAPRLQKPKARSGTDGIKSVGWLSRGKVSLLAQLAILASAMMGKTIRAYPLALASVAGGLENPPGDPANFVGKWQRSLRRARVFLRGIIHNMRGEVSSLDPSVSPNVPVPGDPVT